MNPAWKEDSEFEKLSTVRRVFLNNDEIETMELKGVSRIGILPWRRGSLSTERISD